MSWIDRQQIRQGVVDMLRVNMGVRDAERILVATDVLAPPRWSTFIVAELETILRRSFLARMTAEIAREALPACRVDFFGFEATCQPGSEPPPAAAARFKETDVLVAIVSFSLTHTEARGNACRAGVRVASMPRFVPEMFYPGGPMAVDYRAVAAETRTIAEAITAAETATVRSAHGTDITFSVKGRRGQCDDGLYLHPGAWGNLPAGEAYTAPLEGIGRGRIVVRKGWFPGLTEEDMILRLEDGETVAVEGGGALGQKLAAFLDLPARGAEAKPRRMLAELGVGTNPNARRTDITVEAEKIRGTVHIAIGDGSHMGGLNTADFHQDHVIPEADLILDGRAVMQGGRLLL
jgi:aminopeptidase